MDRLECIKSFVRVVETGSFSSVARELGTTQPTVSKQIAALEDYLDAQLLTRSTRQLKLTEAGDRFYAQAQQVLESMAEAEASVGLRQLPAGVLRVNCPVSFGQLQIVPRIKGFLERYPDIQIKLNMSDRFIDLVESGVDLAIRIGQVQDTALKVQRIGLTKRVAIAATSYLEQHAEPHQPADLAQHNCIIYEPLGSQWHFNKIIDPKSNPSKLEQLAYSRSKQPTSITVSGNFHADSSVAIREAVLSGLGIAVAPIWLFGDLIQSPNLKILMPDYQPSPLPIEIVYRRGRFMPAKVRCFIDYLSHEFDRDPWVCDHVKASSDSYPTEKTSDQFPKNGQFPKDSG